MLLLFSAFVSCMWNGPKGPDSLSFLLPQVSYMHGESSLTACIPCILASASFLNAWEIAPKGQIPMHSCFREFLKCMGNGPKGPDSLAFLLPQVSYMHGEWPQTASIPCILTSASFLYAWGMAPKGQIPMHSCFRKFLICMGNRP